MKIEHRQLMGNVERRFMMTVNLLAMTPKTPKATEEDCQVMYDRFCTSVGQINDDATASHSLKDYVLRKKLLLEQIITESPVTVQLQIA